MIQRLTFTLVALGLILGLATGCNTPQAASGSASMARVATLEPTPEPLTTSLFPADQAVLGDEAVARILSSKVELPARARVAILKLDDRSTALRYYGAYYWRTEDYVRLEQAHFDSVARSLLDSGFVADATPLPTLMTPKQVTIPFLREAAVRMQADLLLVYRATSQTFTRHRVFSASEQKAYSTCEFVLLDTRTGLAPFTRIVTRERTEEKSGEDADLSETARRAEQQAAGDAIRAAAQDLAAFIKSAPKRSSP